MARFAGWCLALAVASISSCQCGSQREPPPEERAAAPDASLERRTIDALEALGDEGAVLVVLRPYHWPSAATTSSKIVGDARVPVLSELQRHTRPEELPTLVLAPLGLAPSGLRLRGWNTDRPLVGSFIETDIEAPVGALTSTLDDDALPTIRHQLSIPASDVAVLTESLRAHVATLGEPWPELVSDHAGAHAFTIATSAVVILPEDDRVRLTIVHPIDRTTDLQATRDRLRVSAAPLPRSAPVGLLLAHDGVLSALVRPWRLRPASVLQGAHLLRRALADAAPDTRAALDARGTQLLLTAELLMGDADADLDESALSLTTDETTWRLRYAGALTEQGRAIIDAAQRHAATPLTVRAIEPWADLFVGIDLRHVLDDAVVPAALGDPERATRALRESGPVTALYTALRFPFGLAALADAAARSRHPTLAPAGALAAYAGAKALPTGVHAVWTGMDEALPRGAIAIQWPTGADPSPITGFVSLAKTDPAYAGLEVVRRQRGDLPLTLVASGIDPLEVFDPDPPDGGAAPLLQARVALPFVARLLESDARSVADLLRAAGTVALRLDHRAGTLLGELVVAAPGEAAEPGLVPLGASGPSGPQGKRFDRTAEACLVRSGLELARGLQALASATPDAIGIAVQSALRKAAPDLECAAAHPDTLAAASALRTRFVELTTNVLIASDRVAAARELVTAECMTGRDAELCATRERLADLPAPTLPETALPGSCGMQWDQPAAALRVAMDADAVAIRDEAIEVVTLATELRRRVPDSTRSIELTVDGDLTVGHARPVLQAIADAGLGRVLLTVRDGTERRAVAADLVPTAPADARPGHTGWTQWSLDAGGLRTTSSAAPVPARLALYRLPDATELATAAPVGHDLWVQAADEIPWSHFVTTIAAACPSPALILAPPR